MANFSYDKDEFDSINESVNKIRVAVKQELVEARRGKGLSPAQMSQDWKNAQSLSDDALNVSIQANDERGFIHHGHAADAWRKAKDAYNALADIHPNETMKKELRNQVKDMEDREHAHEHSSGIQAKTVWGSKGPRQQVPKVHSGNYKELADKYRASRAGAGEREEPVSDKSSKNETCEGDECQEAGEHDPPPPSKNIGKGGKWYPGEKNPHEIPGWEKKYQPDVPGHHKKYPESNEQEETVSREKKRERVEIQKRTSGSEFSGIDPKRAADFDQDLRDRFSRYRPKALKNLPDDAGERAIARSRRSRNVDPLARSEKFYGDSRHEFPIGRDQRKIQRYLPPANLPSDKPKRSMKAAIAKRREERLARQEGFDPYPETSFAMKLISEEIQRKKK